MNNNQTVIEFASATYSVLETDQLFANQIEITVTRSGNINNYNSVELHLGNRTAQEGVDFADIFPTSLNFEPEETEKKLYLDIYDDFELEGLENIELKLIRDAFDSSLILGQQATTTVSILDNETTETLDASPVEQTLSSSPTVEFESATYTIKEDVGLSMTVTLTRNGDTNLDSFVRLGTMGGSATLGLDYGFNNVIYFAEGETSKAVEVFVANDSETEGTETIELQLFSGRENDNYVIGNQNTTTVEIVENVVTNNDMVIAEIGEITNLNHESQTIFFDHDFINPVIFAQPLSRNGGDSSTIRITDIQSNSFSVQVQETTLKNGNFHNGNHTTESFSFLVVEQGIWELSDGSILEVGNINTDAITTSNWETINFNHEFTDAPVVLTQVQTDNDPTFVRTRQDNANNQGFQVALEEEEAYKFSGHGSETIAWLAISPGQGNWDGNQFIAGNTGDQVTHNWHTIDFGNNFTTAPKFLGNISTFDGPDSSGLRYQNLSNSNVQIMIEEDTSNDSETNHTTENINFLAIEADGNLKGSVDSLTGLVTSETGTINADKFELGDAGGSFYDNYGQQDYAEISNFDLVQDTIQLHGEASDYYLGSSPFEPSDQAIFLKVDGMEDELVGIVKDNAGLDINSNAFAFV